ncbi:uncharacterized protein LOC130447933 [Diorhabda sublineata]|uniref:uncharacterized protein LOC130447933 n=1 Tax=Diorhabda sublineata TaxID=1163346 RepID=UPI0024E0BF07|nr:uncharacterized protein LOC130447933 [Diorhabda sublineata]
MSEKKISKLKALGRSASTESTDYSITMGKSVRKKSKKIKPKERWLLTRKTWRYMADAGKKLIPDGAQNRPEDIPKIEAYFQEVCKKEPRFLLWRKNSYPGAIGFRPKKKRVSRKGGSCRNAISADEVSLGKPDKPTRPTHLAIEETTTGKFDVRRLKEEFLNRNGTPTGFSSYDQKMSSPDNPEESTEDKQLINMLEQYLSLNKEESVVEKSKADFNYQDLVDKLQRHLTIHGGEYYGGTHSPYIPSQHVHFEGDHMQRSLLDTLSRYYSQSNNRDKVISDLLTDRRALEKLYFELRKTKGFRGSRGGTGYTTSFAYGPQRSNYENTSKSRLLEDSPSTSVHPPPLIEVQSATTETLYHNWATQTLPIPEIVLQKIEEEYKKNQEDKSDEAPIKESKSFRRRSSVDNDDVSQSVSDTIKRYLRMARKKSVDVDKVDRFKRVNYDRNLRNIKAKGEITKPGDDDGLNKGCQTNDDWILTYRDLKFSDLYDVSDVDSRFSSSRSSMDIGVVDEGAKSLPSSPPSVKSGQSFLSHLLHGKHDKHDKSEKTSSAVASGATMQKSKSSSSVMHHGSRLMAKKIFRSRSKSQTRSTHPCSWTPQGSCIWGNTSGRQVILGDTSLLNLTDIERKVLQKVAIAKLQALNLGVNIKVPTDIGGVSAKPKRRPYLLKRKALTTGIFDASRKEAEKDKENSGSPSGLVFGIPISQCVENDRLTRAAAGTSPFRSRGELSGSGDEPAKIGRHGSRSSFSSLIDSPRNEEKGSCENLVLHKRMVGSVPGLLDSISCSSNADIPAAAMEEEAAVPNILTECFRHLEQNGLHTLGLFRVSTSKKRIRQLREDFDCGKETMLENEQCPHDVATLLKEYLRDLPDPLLCRDLYQAFVQTQKIRNRRLQLEALQHLVQLLPSVNRDTLYALLSFLAVVAKYADDSKNESGEIILGNKMDSNNLATVFAPNILHCIKPGSKEISDKPEDRIDIINVVRTLIDHYKSLFTISAELLDEVYLHMMDSHPEELDILLNKRDGSTAADESVDELDSESNSAPWTPVTLAHDPPLDSIFDSKLTTEQKKTYSREECLHEAAATGGPNIGMRIRHKDRIREKSYRRRREKAEDGKEGSLTSSAFTIISRFRSQKDEDYSYSKNRSSSIESTSSTHTDDMARLAKSSDEIYERRKSSPYVLNNVGVITASLTIPVHSQNQSLSYNVDDDIPFIEDGDNSRQQMTVGLIRTPTAPPRKRNPSIDSDSSVTSSVQPITRSISVVPGYDSAIGSTTTYSSPIQNTPTSISSSIADAGVYSSPPSWTSSPPTSPDSTRTSVNYIPDDVQSSKAVIKILKSNIVRENAPTLQKVSFSSTQEVQQLKESKDPSKTYQREVSFSKQKVTTPSAEVEREPRFTPSITSIGNAVLRSKTADFERIMKDTKSKPIAVSTIEKEKKKYTKRRYTDSRHQTRHIPDAETLESASAQNKREEKANNSQSGPVYKRRELISSVPAK